MWQCLYLLGWEIIEYSGEPHLHLPCFFSGRRRPKLKSIRGLARYRVHTTATWDQFCNIIKKVRNHSDGVFLVFPWLIESRPYKKIQSGTSHITHHTSHITYYIGICKFYKILVIKTMVTFNNSSKLILKTFDKYFLMEIITLTIQTPMSGLKFVKPTISRWNKALSEKFGFS